MSQESTANNSDANDSREKVQAGDLDFIADCKAAFLQEKMPYTNVLLLTVVGFIVAFLIWATQSRVGEIARGHGKIVPSGSTQIVQSLEGGIVSNIWVKEGEPVEQGQLLAKIDDTLFKANYRESLAERDHLIARITRLDAESLGQDSIQFSDSLVEKRPDLVASESLLFNTRREQITSNQNRLQTSLDLKSRELNITRPLAESGVVSQVELIRLETMVNDLEGQIEREKSEYISEVISQNNEYKSSLRKIEETIHAYQDKVARTSIKAPVAGIVNKLHIKTLGGVIQPGAPIVEIVPIGDNLLVQANINPSDIAFIKLEQDATVKLTAYDFAIYGGLEGTVENISADTFVEEDGNSYYQVLVRTGDRSLKTADESLKIIPGMVVQVDIKTGRKSVLDYILKPLMRAKMNAFTER